MARKQEQETARSEVLEVAPDILRLELPIRLPGLGHVNCYALLDDEGATLIDPGLPGPGNWRALQDRLNRAGLRVRDIHSVFVTHSHPDHFGCAARIHRESGARILAHRGFEFGPVQAVHVKPEVSVDDLAAQDSAEEGHARQDAEREEPEPDCISVSELMQRGRQTPWGGQRLSVRFTRRMLWRFMHFVGRSYVPKITHPIEHGDELRLAGREFFALHTPGHTSDHLCLHDPQTGTLLAGDHVLPTITPHISGLSPSRDPLASFFYSLDRVAEIAGVEQVLPAHGHPFSDLRGRAQAIQRHHQERLERIKEISRELGPASVEEFSKRLFKQRSWGSMAESETYAHLEHLRLRGEAECHLGPHGERLYVT